nr:hypothetical protein [Actinomycetales bacterium]
MRLREILREAGRNLASGTTRPFTFALLLAAIILLTAGMDQAAVTGHRIDHERFRAAGATHWIVQSSGAIHVGRCEAMAAYPGVVAAGALRTTGEARLALLPATAVPVREVSPGMRDLLSVPPDGGVWVPHQLAETLGLRSGGSVALDSGEDVAVAAVYRSPGDGGSTLSNTLLTPAPVPPAAGSPAATAAVPTADVPADAAPTAGTSPAAAPAVASSAGEQPLWDECWLDLEVYSESVTTTAASYVPTIAEGETNQTRVQQLTSSLGRSHNLAEILEGRQTQALLWALPVLAALLGYAAARSRRLEFASARHVGVSAPDLAATTLVESLAWACAGGLIATAVGGLVHVALYRGAGLDSAPTLHVTLGALAEPAVIAAVAASAVAAAASGLTNPRLLYHYFRQR